MKKEMKDIAEFAYSHMDEDTSKLILNRSKWPEIDMDLAVNCIESRHKLKGKVQEWYDNPLLVFPAKLSAEQCSSTATAAYKASFAQRIAATGTDAATTNVDYRWKIADLTGGLGVDSWQFAQRAEKVMYNEMQVPLCRAAAHNFRSLGTNNIVISNRAIGTDISPTDLLKDFSPDIVYMDPARRGEGGKKVFLIEDCTPDVLTLKEEIFTICRHLLIKLSPMADISMVCSRLSNKCREVHVIASGGECKELLIWMDNQWDGEYEIHAVELHNDGTTSDFIFTQMQEKQAFAEMSVFDSGRQPHYLFEPGKALMKAGAFNLISQEFGIGKLEKSTHYYIVNDTTDVQKLKGLGKLYSILRCEPLDKRTIKAAGKDFPKADVTARNIPMDTDTLRKKLGVSSGDDTHIFGLKAEKTGNILLVTKRI